MGNQLEKALNAIDPEELDAVLTELENEANIGDNADVQVEGTENGEKPAVNPDIENMQATIDDLTARLNKQTEQIGRMVTLLGARINANPTEDPKPTTVDGTAAIEALKTEDAHANVAPLDSLTVEFH